VNVCGFVYELLTYCYETAKLCEMLRFGEIVYVDTPESKCVCE
jgi:hypothetical protein